MFDDDRGRLQRIGEALEQIQEGLASSDRLAGELVWYRLGRIQRLASRLTPSYLIAHPEIGTLNLPTRDVTMSEPHPATSISEVLALKAIETFLPLLARLPPPPEQREIHPNPDSSRPAVVEALRRMEQSLRAQGIAEIYLFGSVARGEDSPSSDVDIAFEVAEERSATFSLFDQARVSEQIREVVGRPVDFVELDTLDSDMMARMMRDAIKIFES